MQTKLQVHTHSVISSRSNNPLLRLVLIDLEEKLATTRKGLEMMERRAEAAEHKGKKVLVIKSAL